MRAAHCARCARCARFLPPAAPAARRPLARRLRPATHAARLPGARCPLRTPPVASASSLASATLASTCSPNCCRSHRCRCRRRRRHFSSSPRWSRSISQHPSLQPPPPPPLLHRSFAALPALESSYVFTMFAASQVAGSAVAGVTTPGCAAASRPRLAARCARRPPPACTPLAARSAGARFLIAWCVDLTAAHVAPGRYACCPRCAGCPPPAVHAARRPLRMPAPAACPPAPPPATHAPPLPAAHAASRPRRTLPAGRCARGG